VPAVDLDPTLEPYNDESTHLVVGSGHTPGFGTNFDAVWVKGRIEGYEVKSETEIPRRFSDLYVSIHFLGSNDRQRLGPAMRARDVEDIWYAKGLNRPGIAGDSNS
jgi:hypothetical protein